MKTFKDYINTNSIILESLDSNELDSLVELLSTKLSGAVSKTDKLISIKGKSEVSIYKKGSDYVLELVAQTDPRTSGYHIMIKGKDSGTLLTKLRNEIKIQQQDMADSIKERKKKVQQAEDRIKKEENNLKELRYVEAI